MDAFQGETEDHQLTADVTQSNGRHLPNQLWADSQNWHHNQTQSPKQTDQRQSGQNTESWKEQQQHQQWRISLQPDFQDGNLSPVHSLLPANIHVDNTFADYSSFQPSDNFSLLRPNLDSSLASESFHRPPDDLSLPQHPLLQDSVCSEEEQMSSGFLSQHSFLLINHRSIERQPSGEEVMDENRAMMSSPLKEMPEKAVVDDKILLLSKEPPANPIPELLQDNVDPILPLSAKVLVSSSTAPDSLHALLPNDYADTEVHGDQSGTTEDESLNVSIGSRSCELLLRDMQSETQSSQQSNSNFRSPQPTEVARELELAEHFSPAVHGLNKEPELSSLPSQVGSSDLSFLPRSESTTGVSSALLLTSIFEGQAGQPSTIHSNQTKTVAAAPTPMPCGPDQEIGKEDGGPSSQVQSLPSVNFEQKVDAWRGNRGSTNVSLFDSLARQGFSGILPPKKDFDIVSDTMNEILSQKPDSIKLTPTAERSCSEEKDMGSATEPTSTYLDSQSHMNLCTQEDTPSELQGGIYQQQPHPRAEPLSPQTIDHLSHVSPNLDSILTFSKDSHGSTVKLGLPAGASNVLSLDADNYTAPLTSDALTSPPELRSQEVNIDERTLLYLHNLGIDQSPATILKSFAPGGQIREPEFSPTDFFTIKGSVGTSTRSSQPSEGGSPQKREFSQSSIQSVESSLSVPVSLTSLQAAAQQEDEDSYCSTVQTVMRHQRAGHPACSHNTTSPEEAFYSDLDEFSQLVGSMSQTKTAADAYAATGPHILSAEDALLSFQKKTKGRLDFSELSSGHGNPGPEWTNCPLDSVRTSERPTQISSGLLESCGPAEQQTRENANPRPQNDAVGCISQASWRAEPEGCSTAADTAVILSPEIPTTVLEEEENEMAELVLSNTPTHGHAPSPILHKDGDPVATMSDPSSENLLALRVAELLQRESSVEPRTSNTIKQEGSRASEWFRLKMSGQQCELLELSREDRMRIEDIKRELLLRDPVMDSTDTESSTSMARETTQPRADITDDHKGQQSLSSGTSHSGLQLSIAPCFDVEAKEGPRTNTQFFTSITIETRRRTSSPDHSSSPGPPPSPAPEPLTLSHLSRETLPGLELNPVNEAAASRCSRLHLDEVQPKCCAPPSVKVSDLLSEVTGSTRPRSVPTANHLSCSNINLAPKPAEAGQPKHSLLSPDEGLGLSSPPEWFNHREPIKEQPRSSSSVTALFQPICDVPQGQDSTLFTTVKPPTTVTSPRNTTTAWGRNSESQVHALLPYKPHGSEELFYLPQTESGPQSDTTIESSHPDSDDAVPPPFSTHVLGQGDPTMDRGISIRHNEGIYSKRQPTSSYQGVTHRGKSSQMELDQDQRSSSKGSAYFPQKLHDSDHQSGSDLGSPLDQLWLKFSSQWRQKELHLSTEREASLLQRLERLTRLIGIDELRRGRGGPDTSTENPAGQLPPSSQDCLEPAAPPPDRSLPESVFTSSSSVSTVDTSHLSRVFGAERVRRLHKRTSIHKLHRTIQEQKKGKNKAAGLSELEARDQVAAESESSADTFTLPATHLTPTSRHPVGLVSRGVQAVGLEEEWRSKKRNHSREQGLPSTLSHSHSSLIASDNGGREERNPASISHCRRKILPRSISWFISAEELPSDALKENQPAEGMTGGQNFTWFLPYSSTTQWREPLRQRQVPEDHSSSCSDRTWTKTPPSAGAKLSLQEALRKNRPKFIYQSRQRVERLVVRSEDRQLQELYKEVQDVYNVARPQRPTGAVHLKRAVPRMEMIQRSKQIYETLPEVQQRQADQRRKAQYELYRLNARLYNKKITSRVLNRRTPWN